MSDELIANYRVLHESTGESYESIAARVDSSPELAASLRALASPDASAPKARRGKSDTLSEA